LATAENGLLFLEVVCAVAPALLLHAQCSAPQRHCCCCLTWQLLPFDMLADIWSSAPKHTWSQHSVAKSEQDSCLSGNCCTCVSEMSASRVCSHSFAAADHFKCCCAEHIGVSARSPCRNTVSASSFDSARPKESACRKVVVRLVNISLFMSIAKPSAIRSCGRDCGQDGKMRLRSARD